MNMKTSTSIVQFIGVADERCYTAPAERELEPRTIQHRKIDGNGKADV